MGTTDPVRSALTSEYVQKLLKIKAKQLARRPEFRRTDPEDIEHDLIGHVLKQADKYDRARSAPNTFIVRVVDTAAAMLVRDRKRLKRAAGHGAISLDGTVLEGNGQKASLTEFISEADNQRRRGGERMSDDELCDLHSDVPDVLADLPPEHKRIAALLTNLTEAEVARKLRISRRQVRNAVEAIREHFSAAGF